METLKVQYEYGKYYCCAYIIYEGKKIGVKSYTYDKIHCIPIEVSAFDGLSTRIKSIGLNIKLL